MPQISLDTLDDPRLEVYRALKATNLTRWSGKFIAESWRVVERLLASAFPVESVLLSARVAGELAPRLPPELPAYILPQRLAEQLVGYNFHTGVLACGRRRPPPDPDDVVQRAGTRATLVACPHTTDPDNLGTLIRLCAAFGIEALLLGPGCADPFSRRVLRVSMGNAFHLPIVERRDLRGDLVRLRDRWNVSLVATILDPAVEPLDRFTRPPRMALLLGNEADGLSSEWIDLCDRRTTIPMHPGTDSLNVAVAAGIFLYHVTRTM